MKKLITILSVWFSKTLSVLIRLTGKGGGTTLPGYLLEQKFPYLFEYLLEKIPKKIVITGTNGKTTTQTLIVNILRNSGFNVISNISGANLSRGILTLLLDKANLFGKLNYDYGIFEVEEGTFPRIADKLDASIVVVTNLFRDQLDVYGEIDKTKKYITDGIKKTPHAKVILNLNDPKVFQIGEEISNEKYYFGLDEKFLNEFAYEGKYLVENIDQIIKKKLIATDIKLKKDLSTAFKVVSSKRTFTIKRFSAPGFYNVYNSLASILTCSLEGVKTDVIVRSIEGFCPAFGRGEGGEISVGKRRINFKLLLIKNPAGFSITVKMLTRVRAKNIMIIINDNTADGKDVSWLWDAKIEQFNYYLPENIMISGSRAEDMLLRLKYAFDNFNAVKTRVKLKKDVEKALTEAMNVAKPGETLYILPTYTAMLEVRRFLEKKTKLKKFWK
ncbi:DUF1727 domain-containing protein [Candidatus Dojkabacteria bacterium]|nr:DUF1727 domain-containing protein [Candidatus Dojkabacteria bacterium]